MKSEAYLNEIRKAEGLKRAVLKKITVEGNTVTFHLLTDLTYSKEDVSYAEEITKRFVPTGTEGRVSVMKSVPSADGVRAVISEILKNKFPAAAAFISPSDVEVLTDGAGGRFVLSVGAQERAQFAHGDVVNVLSAELMRAFCGTWFGGYRDIKRQEEEIIREELTPVEKIIAPRTFEITKYTPVDGAEPKFAVYIADLSGEQSNISLCGRIIRIEERLTKKEKPFFRITLQDDTAQISASYFTRKATLEKVRQVKEGDFVCLTGNYELFNGNFSFTAKSLDYGAPPENFVPETRPSRPAPAKYTAVTPEPISDLVQGDLFGGEALPPEFCAQKFVVFDLETTGLNCTADHIIEIGAVKIEGGEICEKFSAFVACPVRLSEKIIELTGITDEMLLGAPEIKDVIADFYKFTEGCQLVAHNASFDCGFIRFYGEKEGYLFDQRVHDTLALAQRFMNLPNYKLNTIADRFGFKFNHHRAFDDAFVTAKIFLELVKRNKSL